jgi:hypothetical protein
MLAVAVLVSMMGPAATATSPKDRVTVGGQHLAFGTGPGVVHVGVSANSGASGEDARGQFTFALKGEGDKPIHAKVTCLLVSGNGAIATGVVTQPKDLAGQIVVLEAVDNGGPGSTPPDAIRFSFEGFIVQVSPDCWIPVLPPVDVLRGNVVVHDAV